MRLLAINQFYHPDLAATSQLLTQLCEDLSARGHDVTVISSRGGYLGGDRLPAQETVAGVRVLRAWATGFGKRSVAHRMSDYLTFWASAVATAITRTRPDVMLALTTPPMIAAGAGLVSRARSVPLVTWVQDVYPEIAVAFGVVRAGHPAVRALELLNRLTYAQARTTVVLSEGMARRVIAQGQDPERVVVVPNWSDAQVLRPMATTANAFRAEHGLQGRFVVMYSGNLGRGHDVATLVEAARWLHDRRPDVVFVFVGDGERRPEAERLARGLENVRFLPYQPLEGLNESLAAADVHLASLRPGLEGLLVPSKLYGVLAVGRPLLYIGPDTCELARVIRDHDVGWHGVPGDAAGLADAIAAYHGDPERVAATGERARALLVQTLDRPIAVGRWERLLTEAATSR